MRQEKTDSQAKANSIIVDESASNADRHQKEPVNSEESSSSSSNNQMMVEANPEKKKQRKPRKPPAVAWKKPKGMPKRPLSAYNLFFKVQREAIMTARANDTSEAAAKRSKKETVGIGFANLARTIADKWQSLDNADKTDFLKQAAKEKARYKQEMVVWRRKQKEEKERQACMPPQSVAGAIMPPQQNMLMMGGMLSGGRNLQNDARVHQALLQQGGLQNPYQQQVNNFLLGMHHLQPQQQSPTMMQSYLQELSDNTLLQRQQQQLQEVQARHQLLLSGNLDPSSSSSSLPLRPTPNGPTEAAASYPDTWFELQQSSQRHAMQMNATPFQDGELGKLNPGNKNFGRHHQHQAQLLQDQHNLQQQLQGGYHHLQGRVDVGMLKKNYGDPKKSATCDSSNLNQPLKRAPEASSMGRISTSNAQSSGIAQSSSFHNLASKLDNDTISFLTEFRFNGNSSSSEGTT